MKVNIIADTDAYKQGHASMINPGLTYQYVYGEARVGAKYPTTVVFGMQALLKKYLSEKITMEDLNEAIALSTAANGYNTVNVDVWKRVINECDGILPIIIKCAPEGSVVPVGNVLFTCETTKEWFAKDMNMIEPLLMHIWYPSTVATRSLYIYQSLKPIFEKTGDLELLPFMVNDFGLRGATSRESAILAGMAHLLLFRGSDNLPAVRGFMNYYGVNSKQDIENIISTIKASEHSVPLSYGQSQEKQYLINFLKSLPDDKMGSNVIDTYDAIGYVRNIVSDKEVVELIKKRSAKLVLRPDSGDYMKLIPTILSILEGIFGSTVNDKGYRVLNNVSLIQGDGMDEESIPKLYELVENLGYACCNLAVGSGGGLLQKDLTRDTQRFAIKPSYGIIDGVPYNFMKKPSTDLSKSSKPGLLKLNKTGKDYLTISTHDTSPLSFRGYHDVLQVVYDNGKFLNEQTHSQIAQNILNHINA